MKTYSFTPQGVCAKQITFAIDEQGKLHDVRFIGGCPGNLSAIGKLLEGADPKNVAVLLKGRECKIVCVNRYCMNLLYAPYWGKQR